MNRDTAFQPDTDLPPDLPDIHNKLIGWFEVNGRDLPWRRTRDPYRILVSEVMLQQTQVERVIPRYLEFLETFPDVTSLAAAPVSEVIRIWSGLGYNRRAVNLQRAARAVVDDHQGTFPVDVSELRKLPGVGPYTAGAIACFAHEQDVGFLDTNIRRVLHRLLIGPEVPMPARNARQMEQIAGAMVPTGQGWSWNQALIEFGALHCTARKPACLTCPLQQQCRAFPTIQTILADAYRSGFRRKHEASFAGSNRYYRGRLVETLRSSPEGIEIADIGPLVRGDFSSEHEQWLYQLIESLQRDGLIQLQEHQGAYHTDGRATGIIRLPDREDPTHE